MNKKFFYLKLVILAGSCLFLGWSSHHHVRHLAPVLTAFDPQEKTIDIHVKALSQEESKRVLGYNLLDKGVQPLQITVQNNTPYAYSIAPEAIGLECLDEKKIFNQMKKSMGLRGAGLKVLSVFFWPFIIPTTVDSLHRFQGNKALRKNFKGMAMKEEMIPTYSTLNRLFFIPKEGVKEKCAVTLLTAEKQLPIIFNVVVAHSTDSVSVETLS